MLSRAKSISRACLPCRTRVGRLGRPASLPQCLTTPPRREELSARLPSPRYAQHAAAGGGKAELAGSNAGGVVTAGVDHGDGHGHCGSRRDAARDAARDPVSDRWGRQVQAGGGGSRAAGGREVRVCVPPIPDAEEQAALLSRFAAYKEASQELAPVRRRPQPWSPRPPLVSRAKIYSTPNSGSGHPIPTHRLHYRRQYGYWPA
eukprot:COSAG01_NODE_8808_length_2652_cov_1.687427_3_plen_204_part_00